MPLKSRHPLVASPGLGLDEAREMSTSLQSDVRGFKRLAEVLKRHCGINLTPNEKNFCLMAARLSPVLRRLEIPSYDVLADRLDQGDSNARREFISAMTTNTTEFFREPQHFQIMVDALSKTLARWRPGVPGDLRVWIAASSTGQEAISCAITLLEAYPFVAGSLKILATDIDHDVLDYAAKGVYTEHEIRSVPPVLRQKWFERRPLAAGRSAYLVRRDLRAMIRYAPFNLMTEPYPFRYGFDVIMCRNVFIYFDRATAAAAAGRMAAALRPSGCLFLGHSEGGLFRSPTLQSIGTAAFRRGP